MAICYATSYPFGFPSRIKRRTLETLKIIFTKLRNQDKKVALIQIYEDGALEISSELIRACHNMNTIVQTTGGDEYSLNGISKSPNNTLANTTRALLLNSSQNEEL